MAYKIPLFDLNYGQAEVDAAVEVIRSKWISTGPMNAELEEQFAEMLGAKHAVALASCTAALHLALKVLDLEEGDEVIVPSLTFVATVNAVRYVGATPVFCDIKGCDDLTIDPDQIEALITPRTKAVVVMHYAGFPCEMGRIVELCRRHRLELIEDAAHAPLSEYQGQKLGTIGRLGCFSFFSNKNVSTGEGGMLVTGSAEDHQRINLLRSHGMTTLSYERAKGHSTSYDVVELGYNYRLDDLRAALAVAQLNGLPADLAKRAALRQAYVDGLADLDGIVVPFRHNTEPVSNYIFPIVLKDADRQRRDQVRQGLSDAGVQTSVHYPAVHRFSIYEPFARNLPNTEYVADAGITLPFYSALKTEELLYVIDALKAALA